MAEPFALGLGLFGLGSSLLEGIFNNKNVKRQERAAKMAETIRSAERKDEQSKLGAANYGVIKASSGDRRTFGRSSQAVALSQLVRASANESAIEADKSMRILQISAEASRARTAFLPAAIGGAAAGLSFGSNLQDLLS